MNKTTYMIALFAVVALLASTSVLALNPALSNLEIEEVEVNGVGITSYDDTFHGTEANNYEDFDRERLVVQEEDGMLEVEVLLSAPSDMDFEDLQVEAEISGFEYSDYQRINDYTHNFDLNGGSTRRLGLELELPRTLDWDLTYVLRIRVSDRANADLVQYVNLEIEPSDRHAVDIKRVSLSPSNVVEAGRSLLSVVELENYGFRAEEDVYVTVAIPELGIATSDYVDVFELRGDDDLYAYDYGVYERNYAEATSMEPTEEMFLRIPECTPAGVYTLEVTAEYDYYETARATTQITVIEGSFCEAMGLGSEDVAQKLVLTVGPNSQTVNAGAQAAYAIALSNDGSSSQTYALEMTTGDWAQASLSESLVVLGAGESKVVTAYVNVAENAAAGAHTANLVVSQDGQALRTVGLSANVAEAAGRSGSASPSLRHGIEIALGVLLVILIIVALIVGFSRLRKDEEEDEQAYY